MDVWLWELGVGVPRAVNRGKSLQQRNLGGAAIRSHLFMAVVCSSQLCVLHERRAQGRVGAVLLVLFSMVRTFFGSWASILSAVYSQELEKSLL